MELSWDLKSSKVADGNKEASCQSADDQTEWHNRMRQLVLNEIISSEQSYLAHLDILVKFFLEPIQSAGMLSKREVSTMFGDLATIRNVNQELGTCLAEGTDTIGKAFLKMAPYLRLYSAYASNFEVAVALLQKLDREKKEFSEFRQKQETRPEVRLKLQALLITPVQRIPRYRLLLEELLQHTSPEHEDYPPLQEALIEIGALAKHINEQIRQRESMQRMLVLQRSLVGGQPKILLPGRLLLKEGSLMKLSRKRHGSHERRFFLFTDMLMYAKPCKRLAPGWRDPSHHGPDLECCCLFPIKSCVVSPVGGEGNRQRLYFQIACEDEKITVYSESFADGQCWIEAISKATQQFVESRQTLRKVSTLRKPLRQTDLSKLEQGSQKREVVKAKKRNNAEFSRLACSPKVPSATTIDSLYPLREMAYTGNVSDYELSVPSKRPRLRHRMLGMMTLTPAMSHGMVSPISAPPRDVSRSRVLYSMEMTNSDHNTPERSWCGIL